LYLVDTEPNFVGVVPITIAAGSPPDATKSYPVTLNTDKTYYWRVDESINNSGMSDPNTIRGFAWSFATVKSVPVITDQPDDLLLNAGETAQFEIAVTTISDETYQWYKSADNANDTPGDDTAVGTNFGTLAINNAQLSNEGYYFCKITNLGGVVYSNVAKLAVRRLVAHWTLNQADYVGGLYLDKSGEGHDADPNGTPTFVAGQLVDGIDIPRAAGQHPTTDSWASAGTWNPSEFSGRLTVSFWMKWAGTNGTWQTFVSKRSNGAWDNANVLWQISSDNGLPHLWFQSTNANVVVTNGLVADQWQFIVATFDGTNGTVYINGEQRASGAWSFGGKADAMVCLGGNSFDIGGQDWMNGSLDDVKFYNYALTEMEVAQKFVADAPDKTACVQSLKPDAKFDYNGNCIVDIADFAIFATEWIDCGVIPDCLP
jgi:hypothetical protein